MKMKTWWSRLALGFILCFWGIFIFFYFAVLYPRLSQSMYAQPEAVPVELMIKKWGNVPLDAAKFKNGAEDVRASMVADIVQNQRYLGKPIGSVHAELGDGDLPRYNEDIANYILEHPQKAWKKNALYFLQFDHDRTTMLVRKVSVIRRCCESPYATFLHAKGFLKVE